MRVQLRHTFWMGSAEQRPLGEHLAELKESRAQWLREQVAREGRRLKEWEKERDDAVAAAVSTQQQKRRDQLKEKLTVQDEKLDALKKSQDEKLDKILEMMAKKSE